MTVFGLFLIIAMVGIGGLGLDYANGIRARTQLQVAADSAAHAALMTREHRTETQAKAIAVAIAQRTLPADAFGDTVRASDIAFGTYDAATDIFTPTAGARDAVYVRTQRLNERANGVSTFMLNFAGIGNLDVRTDAIFETYYPTCFREGFVAQNRIDVQSNNIYRNGFCIHSNTHVEVNQNNLFEDNVIVSMPNEDDLVVPANDMSGNPGLANALRSGAYRIRILQRISDIVNGFDDNTSDYFRPDYLSLPVQTTTLPPRTNLDNSVWQPGEIHSINCTGGGNNAVRIPSNTTLRNGVIETSCPIRMGSGVTLENVLIISTNTSLRAIDSAANVTLGRNDNCAPGGGVQIVTMGGLRTTAGFRMFGTQVMAMEMIDFEANGIGMEGVSLITADEIDSTSNMDMGFCNGAGMENNFDAQYFRLAH